MTSRVPCRPPYATSLQFICVSEHSPLAFLPSSMRMHAQTFVPILDRFNPAWQDPPGHSVPLSPMPRRVNMKYRVPLTTFNPSSQDVSVGATRC